MPPFWVSTISQYPFSNTSYLSEVSSKLVLKWNLCSTPGPESTSAVFYSRLHNGLNEYCWISCSWQGLQTRSGLMEDGSGSSLTEQASQKTPPQFLQRFLSCIKLASSLQSEHNWATTVSAARSCSSCILDDTLFTGKLFFWSTSSWTPTFSSCLHCLSLLGWFLWGCWIPLLCAGEVLLGWMLGPGDRFSFSRFNSCSRWDRCFMSCSMCSCRLSILSPNSCLKSLLASSADWRSRSACRNLDLSHMNLW